MLLRAELRAAFRDRRARVNSIPDRLKVGKGVQTICIPRTWNASRLNVDEEACLAVMRRFRLKPRGEAANLALHKIAAEPLSLEDDCNLQGSGWEGDLEEMRTVRSNLFRSTRPCGLNFPALRIHRHVTMSESCWTGRLLFVMRFAWWFLQVRGTNGT